MISKFAGICVVLNIFSWAAWILNISVNRSYLIIWLTKSGGVLLNKINSIAPINWFQCGYQIMARANTKIGDVFSVKIEASYKKYFQLVAFDLTQLNSDVIRAFKKACPVNAHPDLSEIVNGEVEFYAHCVTKLGLKMDYWKSVGNISNIGNFDNVLFRSSGDNPQTRVSQNWWIWKINEEQRPVGKLTGENRKAEIGSVIPPDSIVYRMQTGKYDFVYPDFE